MTIKSSDITIGSKQLKYGMVGGGPGAFIGQVHRDAIALDGKCRIVAGSFSSDKEKNQEGNNPDCYCGIGDIEYPPAIDMQPHHIYVEEVEIEEIDHPAESDAIDNISDGTARDSAHRHGKVQLITVDDNEIDDDQEDQQRRYQIEGTAAETGSQSAALIVNKFQLKEGTHDLPGLALDKATEGIGF